MASKGAPYIKKKDGTYMPVVYATHGGGPMPLMGDRGHKALTTWFRQLATAIPRPKAILVISAHWEERVATVNTCTTPPMLYDYSGFPPETYKYNYPAPGASGLASRVVELLKAADIPCEQNVLRGYDHGAFVPLMLAYPEADIPVTQLSLVKGLDPTLHINIGRALSDLRAEGVLVLGSGSSYHNMRAFNMAGGSQAAAESVQFDTWLTRVCAEVGQGRAGQLVEWKSAPAGLACHPREEHLLPLMVVVGVAGDDPGRRTFSGLLFDKQVSCFQFGRK